MCGQGLWCKLEAMKKTVFTFFCLVVAMVAVADDNVAKGDSCRDRYDMKHALVYYETALDETDNASVRMRMAECYYRQNRWANVIKVLAPLPDDSLDHDAMRQLFFSNGQLARVGGQQEWGRKIVARWPMDGEIVAALARSYLIGDMTDEADKLCNDYWLRDETNNAVNNVMADIYLMQRQWPLAKASYQLLLQQGDSTYKNLFNLGACYEHEPVDSESVAMANRQKARETFEAAVRVSMGSQPGALYHLGVLLNDAGEHERARECFSSALSLLRPDSSVMFTCYRGLGEGCYAAQDWQEANRAFKEALAYRPSSYTTLYYLGITCEALRNFKEAVDNYSAFLLLAAEVKEPTAEMSQMMTDARKRREALAK